MKPTHFKTLSARIKELHELFVFAKIDLEQFFHLTLDANKQCETIVTLAHFVPCDENGVPLEKPIHIGYGIAEQAEADARKAYNEAQKSVIFEGWEVVSKNIYGGITIRNLDLNTSLHFFGDRSEVNFRIKKPISKFEDTNITLITLADLAAATTENPIKLKQ